MAILFFLFLKCIDIFGVRMCHCNECLWYRENDKIGKGFCLFYGMEIKNDSNICIDFRNENNENL